MNEVTTSCQDATRSGYEVAQYLRKLGAYAARYLTRAQLEAVRLDFALHQPLEAARPFAAGVKAALRRPLAELRRRLVDDSAECAALRAFAPLELVVLREKRKSMMRAVAGGLRRHGVTMSERWSRGPTTKAWPDILAETMIANLADVRAPLSRFVRSLTETRC